MSPEVSTVYRLYCISTIMLGSVKFTAFALVHHSQQVNGMAGKIKSQAFLRLINCVYHQDTQTLQ